MAFFEPTNLLSIRKKELESEINESQLNKDIKKLALLHAQWVHRYGLDNLPTNSFKSNFSEQLVKPLIDEPSTTAMSEGIQSEDLLGQINTQQEQIQISLVDSGINLNSLKDEEMTSDSEKEIEDDEGQMVQTEKSKSDSLHVKTSIQSPPISKNKLRKWLPLIDDEMQKAS